MHRTLKIGIIGDYDPELRYHLATLDHPFYVATLFVPQVSSQPGNPHPLIISYLKAALSHQIEEGETY
jgi:CTP synthase (UTP-ammonia lyase)